MHHSRVALTGHARVPRAHPRTTQSDRDTLAVRTRNRHGGHSQRTNWGTREKGARTPGQHGRMTPDNATHAGYTTATAHTTRQPPSHDAHRDTHAGEPHTHARLTRTHTIRTHTQDRQPWLHTTLGMSSKAEAGLHRGNGDNRCPAPSAAFSNRVTFAPPSCGDRRNQKRNHTSYVAFGGGFLSVNFQG